MKQVVRHWSHTALWVLAMVVLAGTLGAFVGVASASSSKYTLIGVAEQPGGVAPVPAGVQVDLVSRATGAVYTTTINGTGGGFQFTSSGTGGALAPGFWGVYLPVQTNLSLKGFSTPVAVLPENTAPVYVNLNATDLTSTAYATVVSNVTVVTYAATLTGTVTASGSAVAGATVSLLDPAYNTVTLVGNLTNSTGAFSLRAPLNGPTTPASWVLRASEPGAVTLYNLTSVTISSRSPAAVNVVIQNYLVTGRVRVASGAPVVGTGNVTLLDTTTGAIFTAPTDTGFYSIGAYPGSFDVFLATTGYTTAWYPLTVSAVGPFIRNVTVAPISPTSIAQYNTTIDLSGLSPVTGTGSVTVTTNASLGNYSVIPALGNASVRQLWVQLGLHFTGTASFPSADGAALQRWINSTGPFFPAVQAGLAVNGTAFSYPSVPPAVGTVASACTAGSCGEGTPGGISYAWQSTYALNGTLARNAKTYTLSFSFRHPSNAQESFNYTFVLPTDYVLAAGTTAPAQAALVPRGLDHTWTTFTLESLPSATPAASATFSLVRAANLTANVNVSVSNFAFSSRNVLNATHNNYTVIVGVGQNVTFSALNSTYPTGQNGTKFVWNFGDSTPAVTTHIPTTNHTYSVASGATPYSGSLNVTSSSGISNLTTFHIWVAQGSVTAKITGNWSASQYSAVGPYVRVNWSTSLGFNASQSVATISGSAPIQSVISASVWTFTAKGYRPAATNLSAGQRSNPLGTISRQFLGAGTYYTNLTLNGTPIAFHGWVYNLTLTVWSGTGQSASTSLQILVNDTEPPVAGFSLQTAAGKGISSSGGIQVGQNGTAQVVLNATNATDPHNGSISRYYWLVTNPSNSTFHFGINTTTPRVNGILPSVWLRAANQSYRFNLTVWDLANNHAYAVQSLTVAVNSSYNVILSAENLTAPTTFTSGTAATFWVNVTVGGGTKATAQNVTVTWYLLSAAGTGSRTYIGGTVTYYAYSSGVVNATSFASGKIATLAYKQTVRAQVTWTPSTSGNFVLYANATASNEYAGNYVAGTNLAQQAITVKQNPTTQLLTYVGIAAAVVVAIALLVYFAVLRPRRRRTSGSSTRPGRSADRKPSKPAAKDDADEDDDA